MSVTRRIQAILTADASQFEHAMKQATGAVSTLDNAGSKISKHDGTFRKLSNSLRENSAAWDNVSNKALIGGAALAAGLGLAAREAISWESAWAGVTKTVSATPAQFAELEQGLRNLTKILPATHEEIAGVAEAAGQLGVARGDILAFTETAIALGESTNLSADEAATGLAQLANVMGTTSREGVDGYSKLGSALVALGNNGASTESQILDMSLRIAGAATVVGASESDVLALANAMASVGIEAQLGGGVISRVMLEINSAVSEGGESMADFARVAGVSATEFASMWEADPVAAVGLFVAGLDRITAQGGDAAGTLDELGLSGTQNAQVLLRMAGSSDMLTESLELGKTAWEENNALQEEAAKRYETTESKLQIARNSMRDAAIDAGAVLGPALAEVAGWAAAVADAFVKLPKPLQQGIVGLTGVASAGLLLVGGGIKAARAMQELGDSLKLIGARGPAAAKGVTALGTAARGATMVLLGLVAAGALLDWSKDKIGVEKLTADLLGAEDAAGRFNSVLADLAVESKSADSEIRSLGDAIKYSVDPPFMAEVVNVLGKFVGIFSGENTSDIALAGERLGALDQSLAGLVAGGNADEAARLFTQMAAEAEAAGYSTEEFTALLPLYAEGLAAAEVNATTGADANKGWAVQAEAASAAAEESASQIRDMAEAMLEQYNAAITASNANVAYEEALVAASEAAVTNGKTAIDNGNALDISTEAGRNNTKQLNALAEQAKATAEANLANGDSVDAVAAALDASRKDFITAAQNMGLNEAAANRMADDFGVASGTAQVLRDKLGAIPNDVNTNVTLNDRASAKITYIKRGIDGLRDKTVTVRVVTQGSTGGGIPIDSADGNLLTKTRAGLVQAFANGGTYGGTLGNAQPQIRPYQGPRGVLWGEEGSGPWEAFISGHPAKRSRSRGIADDVVARLGGRIDWVAAYANGGIRDSVTNTTVYAPAPAPAAGPGQMRISGTLDLGGGVMGRVMGAVEMVEDFTTNAPVRSRMQAGVR